MIFGRRARGIVAAGPDAVNAALTAPRQRVPLPRNPTVSPFSDLAEHCSSSNTRCPAQNTLARSPMSEMQARLKPEFSLRYPRWRAVGWYDFPPFFPGVTVRRVDIFGRRITRLKTNRDFETVQESHFDFRARPAEVEAESAMA